MSDIWYRSLKGLTEGPITLRDLQHMADIGTLKPTDLISQDGVSWKPAGETAEVRFYAANIHSLNYPAPSQQPAQVTPRIVDLMRQTALWVRIMSVVIIVSCGLMIVCGAIITLVGILNMSHGASDPSPLAGIAYIAFGILYLAPAFYLHRYASYAKSFARLRSEQELEEAIQAQKSFWKFVAILALVMIGLNLIMIPIIIIAVFATHAI